MLLTIIHIVTFRCKRALYKIGAFTHLKNSPAMKTKQNRAVATATHSD